MSIYLGGSICLLMFGIKSRLIFGSFLTKDHSIFLGFFIPLAVMNAIEITFYFENLQSLIGLKLYYICALCSIGGALFTSLKITRRDNLIAYIYSVLALITAGLFLFSNRIIDGYFPFLLTITATRSDMYYVWQATALMGLLTIIVLHINCLVTKNSRQMKAMSFAFLTSISMPLLLGLTVIICMAMGFKINATVWLPISTTAFMLLSNTLINEDRIIDLRSLFSSYTWSVIRRILVCDNKNSYPLKNDLRKYEKILIQNSLQDTIDSNGHVDCKASSQQLSVSETTIRRKKSSYKNK